MARISRPTRIGRHLAVLALVAGLVTVIGQAPASAETPTVTITPSTVTSGESIDVDLAGFPVAGFGAIQAHLCPASFDPTAGGFSSIQDQCTNLSFSFNVPDLHATVRVSDSNSPSNGPFTCSALPDGCVVLGSAVDLSTGELLASVSTAITIVPPAQTITPPSSARSGQTMTVQTTGFPAGQPGAIGLCPADVTAATVASCGSVTAYPSGVPTSAEVLARAQVDGGGTWFRCEFGVCVIAAWTTEGAPGLFAKSLVNVLAVGVQAVPASDVEDGQTVPVSVSNAAPGPATVQQCPYGDGDGDGSTCTEPQAFTVGDSGAASVAITFHDPFTGADGQGRTCGDACDLRVLTSDGPLPYTTQLTFPKPSILVVSFPPFADGDGLQALLTNFPVGDVAVAQCAADDIGVDLASSSCANPQIVSVAGPTPVWSYVVHPSFVGRSGTVDCRTDHCVIAAFGAGGAVAVGSTLTFLDPLGLTLDPPTDLHDDAPISVTATGLHPSQAYRIARCLRGDGTVSTRCERPLPSPLYPDWTGRLSTTTTAVERFTTGGLYRNKVCRDTCSIAVIDSNDDVVVEKPFALASPKVAAAPDSGVQDGSTVTVTGTDLEPTYAGPTVLFPTGGWASVQCDKAVGTTPTIIDVFTHCGLPTGAGAVDVPGTTSSSTIRVQATLDKILGGTTDCTASPGACVVGVVRWEQDASVSAAFTPLTFG